MHVRRTAAAWAAAVMVSGLAACVPPPTAAQRATLPLPSTAPAPAARPTVGASVPLSQQLAGVRVRAITCTGLSIGSSFAVAPTTLVTNRHVVAGARQLQLDTATGQSVPVAVAGAAYVADLAIVRTATPVSPVLTLAPADPAVGAAVTAVGYPQGGVITTTSGRILAYAPDPLGATPGRVLVTDAYATHGNSGGPLLDAVGRVVGVIYAADSQGHSLAIPVSTLRPFLSNGRALGPVPPCGQR